MSVDGDLYRMTQDTTDKHEAIRERAREILASFDYDAIEQVVDLLREHGHHEDAEGVEYHAHCAQAWNYGYSPLDMDVWRERRR